MERQPFLKTLSQKPRKFDGATPEVAAVAWKNFLADLNELPHRAFALGLFGSGHVITAALKVTGFEVAKMIEQGKSLPTPDKTPQEDK